MKTKQIDSVGYMIQLLEEIAYNQRRLLELQIAQQGTYTVGGISQRLDRLLNSDDLLPQEINDNLIRQYLGIIVVALGGGRLITLEARDITTSQVEVIWSNQTKLAVRVDITNTAIIGGQVLWYTVNHPTPSASNGFPIGAGESDSLVLFPEEILYAIADGGTVNARILVSGL